MKQPSCNVDEVLAEFDQCSVSHSLFYFIAGTVVVWKKFACLLFDNQPLCWALPFGIDLAS
jgi:hypothetical protein